MAGRGSREPAGNFPAKQVRDASAPATIRDAPSSRRRSTPVMVSAGRPFPTATGFLAAHSLTSTSGMRHREAAPGAERRGEGSGLCHQP